MLHKPGGQKIRLIELAFALPQAMERYWDDDVEFFACQPGIVHRPEQEITQKRRQSSVAAVLETFHQLPRYPLIAAGCHDCGEVPVATIAVRTGHQTDHRMGTHRAQMFRWSQNSIPAFPAKELIPGDSIRNAAPAGCAMSRIEQAQQWTEKRCPGSAEQGIITGSQGDKVAVACGDGARSLPESPRATTPPAGSALRAPYRGTGEDRTEAKDPLEAAPGSRRPR